MAVARKGTPKPSLKKHSACASTVEIAYNVKNITNEVKWNEEELDEIIDTAVHLMEYALQRKPCPEFPTKKDKKRLPTEKLVLVYEDMSRIMDNEIIEVECQEEFEYENNENCDLKEI